MNVRRIILPCLFLILFLSCFIASNFVIKKSRKDLSAHYSLNIRPVSPDVITLLAGEFRGLMADYLLMEIGSFIGSNRKISGEQWEEVCLGFKQAQKLDPYFQQIYLMAQGFLTWDAKAYSDAVKILNDSWKHRPWDWRPGYYMGFDYYYFLDDYATASRVFLKAAMIKNSPPLLAVLGGRLAVKGKRIEAAIVMLKTMLNNNVLDDNSKKKISERIKALRGVLLIENSINKYRKTFGSYPFSLKILLEKGFLARIPDNPYSERYYYNSKNGQVFFDTVRAKQY